MRRADSLEKTLMLGKIKGRRRGWQIASLTQWTWIWANSGRWWWTGKPGVLQSTGLQKVEHNLATEHTQRRVQVTLDRGQTWIVVNCLVAQSCLTLCDPMDCSTPGFSSLHYLLEFTQGHVHWVSDAIQPSHPLSSPSPPAFNLPQHLGSFSKNQLFASSGQSIGAPPSASVLPMKIQG